MLRRDEVVLHVVDQFGVDVYGVIRGHALNARAQVRRQMKKDELVLRSQV